MESYKKYINIDMMDFLKMTKDELKIATQSLGYTANQRIRNLHKAHIPNRASKTRPFSVRGKDLNQLRGEFYRAKSFLSMKTSSVRGAKEVVNKFVSRVTSISHNTRKQKEHAKELGQKYGNENYKKNFRANYIKKLVHSNKFWETYNKLGELYDIGGKGHQYDSLKIQEMLVETFANFFGEGKSVDEILDYMIDKIDEEYNKLDHSV